MQVSIQLDKAQLRAAERMLREVPGGIDKAMPTAVNKTAAQTKTWISKAIRSKVNIKAGDIKDHIKISPRATRAKPTANVALSKTDRLPLKYFGAKQNSRGVRYRIAKGGGRKGGGFIPSAFIVKTLGAHVFTRHPSKKMKGRPNRAAITKKLGPSPWGVFVKSGMPKQAEKQSSEILAEQVRQSVRFVLLKHRGRI